MAIPIAESEIKAGWFITAYKWRSTHDRSYVGSVLKVIAVDLPFIVVEEVSDRWGLEGRDDKRMSLDAREIEFGSVSEAYIKAMTEKQKPAATAAVMADDCDDDLLAE